MPGIDLRETPEPEWVIGIGTCSYEISGSMSREDAIRLAWKRHKGTIGLVIDTRRTGEPDSESIPWRSVDVAYRIIGDYKLAELIDDAAVEYGFPSMLPPLV